MRGVSTFLTCTLLVVGPGGAGAVEAQARARASAAGGPSAPRVPAPVEERLRAHVEFLASDELGGRHSFAPSIDIAARYLATRLAAFGYEGGAPGGGLLQAVPLDSGTVDADATYLVLRSRRGADTLSVPAGYMLETVGEIPSRVETPLAFAGYGISAPRLGHDDFAELDVRGSYVVTVNGRPSGLEDAPLEPGESGQAALEARGAVGLVVVSQGLLSNYDRFSSGYAGRRVVSIREPDPTPDFQVVQAGPELVRVLADLLGLSETALTRPNGAALEPRRHLGDLVVNTVLSNRAMPTTHNVIGVLPGSDPDLADEYVFLTAHYDGVTGDSTEVFNAADDNASGTAAVLEVARELAAGPRPARSIVVVFFTAEEFGLIGSEWLVDHSPPAPLERIAAVLDADMVGRSTPPDTAGVDLTGYDLTGPDETYLLGPDPLRGLAAAVALETDPELRLLDFGTAGVRYRGSDHWTFHRRGVPSLWFTTGIHPDWHETTDDADRLDYAKLARITRVMHAIAARVADRPEALSRPGREPGDGSQRE